MISNNLREYLAGLPPTEEIKNELRRRKFASPGGLIEFIRYFWDVLEPTTPFVDGWALRAIAEHLEAVSAGKINRLLINVPPGFAKSLVVNTFWPAHEWAVYGAHLRYVSFSYAAHLTARDNEKFRDLLLSPKFRAMYGRQFTLVKVGAEKVQSDKTGWKFASSVGGVGTGERGDRILCFPAHEIVQTEVGPQRIGDIVENHWQGRVWSVGVDGRFALKPVEGWRRNPASRIMRFTFDDGSILDCTPDHRLMTPLGAVRAETCFVGQFLHSASGRMQVAAAGVVHDRQTKMRPHGSVSYSGDSAHADAKFGSKQPSRVGVASGDFPNHFFGQVNNSVGEAPLRFGVENVLQTGSVLNVVEPRVAAIRRLVSDFLTSGARSDERFGDQLVNHSVDRFSSDAESHSWVSLIECVRHDFAGDRQRPPSAVNDTREAADTPKGGDFVNTFGADNSRPTLRQIVRIDLDHSHAPTTYCLTVADNHNMLCGRGLSSILVKNCDDPHNVREAESESVRENTVQWFREAMQNRLNDLARGCIIVIMQRVNEGDVSGCIFDNYPDYEKLVIPMEYESDRRCSTSIGWTDPREEDGELAWPERYPDSVLQPFKSMPYVWAGQYQQRPEPRGGGIIKRDYWKVWDAEAQRNNDVKPGCYPTFDYVIASFDGALGQKQENDWSALTVWGTWIETSEEQRVMEQFGTPSIMLIAAWRKKLTLHGRTDLERMYGETKEEFEQRRKSAWGLVEHIADTCRKLKVNKLLIEAKANGHDVANEMRRLYGREDWMIVLDDPGNFDKTARTYSIQHFFADGRVWRPDTDWADMVETEMAQFPKGAHDDLHDSSVMALRHLRRMGLLVRAEENTAAVEAVAFPKTPKRRQLYEV